MQRCAMGKVIWPNLSIVLQLLLSLLALHTSRSQLPTSNQGVTDLTITNKYYSASVRLHSLNLGEELSAEVEGFIVVPAANQVRFITTAPAEVSGGPYDFASTVHFTGGPHQPIVRCLPQRCGCGRGPPFAGRDIGKTHQTLPLFIDLHQYHPRSLVTLTDAGRARAALRGGHAAL
jgi:hypothetical protein